jgi:hypothetical protein
VVICSKRAWEPAVGVTYPEVSMVTPRFSARGRSVSVDGFSGERPLVGAAEQEQCFGEVERSGVDGAEALVERAAVAVRIAAGDVEQCLRDRQWSAQFVGSVGCEPLLFGDVCFEPGEHGVEGVGEFAELISAAR